MCFLINQQEVDSGVLGEEWTLDAMWHGLPFRKRNKRRTTEGQGIRPRSGTAICFDYLWRDILMTTHCLSLESEVRVAQSNSEIGQL